MSGFWVSKAATILNHFTLLLFILEAIVSFLLLAFQIFISISILSQI